MTKADLIDLIAERAKLPHGRAELLICQMFDSMVDALCRGEGIEIRGFGSFSIRSYKEYQGRNPRTGEAVRVRPTRLAFFKVGKELRERVNARAASNGVPNSSTPSEGSGTGGT
jgi:integration host factor subunit beta